MQQARALEARNVLSPCSIEGLAGGRDGDINVLLGPLYLMRPEYICSTWEGHTCDDGANHILSCRVDRTSVILSGRQVPSTRIYELDEFLGISRRNKFVVDEETCRDLDLAFRGGDEDFDDRSHGSQRATQSATVYGGRYLLRSHPTPV